MATALDDCDVESCDGSRGECGTDDEGARIISTAPIGSVHPVQREAREREPSEGKSELYGLEQHERGGKRPPAAGPSPGSGCRDQGDRRREQGCLEHDHRDVAGNRKIREPLQRRSIEHGLGKGRRTGIARERTVRAVHG